MDEHTAEHFLAEAERTLTERGVDYDSPRTGERSIKKTVALFNLRTGRNLTETEGWIFMGYLKDVRQDATEGLHYDSAVDRVSYAALEAESRVRAHLNMK